MIIQEYQVHSNRCVHIPTFTVQTLRVLQSRDFLQVISTFNFIKFHQASDRVYYKD